MLMPLYLVSAPFTVSSAPLTGGTGGNQDTYEKNHCYQEHDFFHIFEGWNHTGRFGYKNTQFTEISNIFHRV
jgi:hypothetical protein